MQKLYKRYVDVIVHTNPIGEMTPLYIVYDGRKYPIERILAIRNAASSVGGGGILYECRISSQVRNLYYERSRWFIESNTPY